ncbi:MAG: hypothetical protein ACYC8T_10095 [Myxococcaceae bacterium]
MSEYQYYEFQAIDRALTERETATLRGFSSRATITPTRFVNNYSYGSFKGNTSEWMAKYFDAFLYLANWGTHQFMLRLPARMLSLKTAQRYCVGEAASAKAKGDHVVLEFRSEDEEGGEWIDEEHGTLASLVPLRTDLVGGDLRALYLAWILSAQLGELDDGDMEPPCPPGLRKLTAPLEAFVEFMRIDRNLIEAAATASPELAPTEDAALERWVAALPEAEKTTLLVRMVGGTEAHLRAELIRRFRESRAREALPAKARTVGELLEAAEGRAEERRRQKSEHAAREKARREREAAEARERHLVALAKREAEAWRELDALIATKQPKKYDEAVALLGDLRDVCARGGRQVEAATRIARLRREHTKKPSLIERFRKAGLTT